MGEPFGVYEGFLGNPIIRTSRYINEKWRGLKAGNKAISHKTRSM